LEATLEALSHKSDDVIPLPNEEKVTLIASRDAAVKEAEVISILHVGPRYLTLHSRQPNPVKLPLRANW
jgi:hypothetical protein